MTRSKYVTCSESDIPEQAFFVTPSKCQGQTIEVSYGGYGPGEPCDGAPYKRVIDHSKPIGHPDRVSWYCIPEE